jgi:hypothetical protein
MLALAITLAVTITICLATVLVGVPSFLQCMILIFDKEWRAGTASP